MLELRAVCMCSLRICVAVCVIAAAAVAAAQPASTPEPSAADQELAARLVAARTDPEVEAILAGSKPTLALIKVVSGRAAAAAHASDTATAVNLDDLAFRLAARSGDPVLETNYAINASNSRDTAGDLVGALELSRKAVTASRLANDPATNVRALIRLCTTLRKTGDPAEAI